MLIAIANTKGGVGKSTIAVHAAEWLSRQGFKVALLDLDRQRSSSVWLSEAAPQITIRTADNPDDALSEALGLAESHDFIVADAPGGLDDLSRTVLLLARLAVFPITPSILDLRSVQGATATLRYAQQINGGRPEGRLVLNRMKAREVISRELQGAAKALGLQVADSTVRDLQAFRDAAQQGTVVSKLGSRSNAAASDMEALLVELLGEAVAKKKTRKASKQGGCKWLTDDYSGLQ